jgi:drug/metabolite transporter (DMT)-like permease
MTGMGGVALALAAAVTFGAGDFAAGMAARRSSALLTALVAQVAGLTVIVPAVLVQGAPFSWAAVGWGVLGGFCGGVGMVVFFRALADGVMATAAPVTAVAAAGLPVLAGVLLGERPEALVWVGMGLGLLAVGAISGGPRGPRPMNRRLALAMALTAGAGFGLFFVFVSRAPASSGPWVLLAGRLASMTLPLSMVAAGRLSWRFEGRGTLGIAALSGVMDMSANALFVLAVRRGELATVSVLASLYPAITVGLALLLLRERLRIPQMGGVALALLAVGLISRG